MSFLQDMFRALKHDNYRYFFLGQVATLIGMWMQSIALSWLIYRLTGSSTQLGLVNFCNQLPVLLLVSLGGIVADRYDRRRIVIRTQATCMFLSALLAFLTLSDLIQVWHLYCVAIAYGLTQAFDMPARQALVVELVGKEDLPNAIILNSSMINGARLIGPAVAGFVIEYVGEGWCFAINSASYIGVLSGLFAMKLASHLYDQDSAPLQHYKEGLHFVFGNFPVLAILFMLGSISLLAAPQVVLMPAVVKDVLHGDANTMGYLMTMSGVGAFVGALALALKKKAAGMENIIAGCMLACGVTFIIFGHSKTIWFSMLLMAPIGLSIMGQMATSNTLIQTLVPDHLRGQIMSFHAMMFMGGSPVGALLSGWAAEQIGIPLTFTIAGCLMLAIGLTFCFQLRRFKVLSARLLTRTERINALQLCCKAQLENPNL